MIPRRAAATLAACLLLAGCTPAGSGSASTPTPEAGVDVLSLAVGDCLDLSDVTGVTATVPVVDCAAEHDAEAYARVVLDDGSFPGAESVTAAAEAGCSGEFDGFVGLAYDASTLDYSYYFPTEGSWAEGDRRILCLVMDPETRVTGSLEGAAR